MLCNQWVQDGKVKSKDAFTQFANMLVFNKVELRVSRKFQVSKTLKVGI